MQPQRGKDNQSVGSWLFSGLSLKTIVVATAAVTGTYYIQQGRTTDRIAIAEQRGEATGHRLDETTHVYDGKFANQLAAIQSLRETTLRKDTYDRDQARLDGTLRDLSDRQRTTDEVLMQRGLGHR